MHRVDGGKAFEQPPDSASFVKKGKGKQLEVEPIIMGSSNVDAESQLDLLVVKIGEAGQVGSGFQSTAVAEG